MIAILVPVLGRAEQIEPLLASLEATTYRYRVVLICSPKDSALATATRSGADVLVSSWAPDRGDYAKKLTLAVAHTDEPWLFQGATDLKFMPGWDTAAVDLGTRTSKGVIGTNDLGNPAVIRGRQSTHSLVSRSYIERYGGTFDNTGAIFSEQYDHQYTDIEFIDTARWRQEFAFAKNSIVEHLHPLWGKGHMDPTYEKALRHGIRDRSLYLERRKQRLQTLRRR